MNAAAVIPEPTSDRFLFFKLQALGWGGCMAMALLFTHLRVVSWEGAFAIIPLRAAMGLGMTTALRPLYRSWRTRPAPPASKAFSLTLASALIAVVDGLFTLAIADALGLLAGPTDLEAFLLNSTPLRILLYLVWGILYFGIHYWMTTRHTKLYLARLEADAREHELQMLRAQINPHFLFNALNSIQAESRNAPAVTSITQALSDYLRFSLSQQGNLLPLWVELDALENYLRVEKARFEEKLEYRIEATVESREIQIPIALVQTLLDNAIKYGQCSSIRPVRIAITARMSAGALVIHVANSGEWVSDSTSTGTGLQNIRRRLHLIYGPEASLAFDLSDGQVLAIVKLPTAPLFPEAFL